MTKISFLFALLSATLVCLLPAAPAQAQVNRTFVSAAGSDSNNCANVTTPCRHFGAAFAATALSGEIFVLDPANYGSLTITHAVSIEGHGWASVAPPNGGNAITINANPGDRVSINGVVLDGTGATGGTNGIVFNSGGSLAVTDCVVQNFGTFAGLTGIGILMQPTSDVISFAITNTKVLNNANTGITYLPPSGSAQANGAIDHVVVFYNGIGIFIYTVAGGGSTAVAISNTIVTKNFQQGIGIANGSGPLAVSIDNTSINSTRAGTDGVGIAAYNTSNVTLGRSVITANRSVGIINGTSPNSFFSYQDNRIDGNGNSSADDVNGALSPLGLK